MKVEIPEELKAELPPTLWGRILTATPVVMAVVATGLAGLASSEMTRAQYERSLAAQEQAKAGDQWGFFQAKRLRGSMQRTTLDLIQSTTEVLPLGAAELARLDPATTAALLKGEIPALPPPVTWKPSVKAAFDLLEAAKPEPEIALALASVTDEDLTDAVRAVRARADAFDASTRPQSQAIDGLEKSLSGGARERLRDLTAARARYSAARYEMEARLNQVVAQVIELQVRKSNITAERHSRRSQRFFFGMLAAQAAVIICTMSIAARNRSMLWTVAAVAGLAAVGFAVYVYFYV